MEDMREIIADRIGNVVQVPQYNTVSTKLKNGKPRTGLPSYWVEIKNTRTGYTKVMPRTKAFRYINNRPGMWSYTNPLVEFKDTYELTK